MQKNKDWIKRTTNGQEEMDRQSSSKTVKLIPSQASQSTLLIESAKKSKNYSMQYSHVVTHHSTNCTSTSLTSGIGRDPVLSSVYGRS